MNQRCAWVNSPDPIYAHYHDTEWGVPEYNSRALWEKLMLDGFQAGLAWITILRKRDTMRLAFDGFDPDRIAAYTDTDRERLLADPGIIRSKSKIEAAIGNAGAYIAMRETVRTSPTISGPLSAASRSRTAMPAWPKYRPRPNCPRRSRKISRSVASNSLARRLSTPSWKRSGWSMTTRPDARDIPR